MEERLQKLLAQAGLCSRREAERWITDGRVTVNGRTASVGDKADLRRDKIMVDGRPLGGSEEKRLWLTFDEGYENGCTADILDTLKEKNVRAVFFVTYDYCKRNPELVRRMIAEGHTVGNHTWSHPSLPDCFIDPILRFLKVPDELYSELSLLHDYVKKEFGYEMYVMRPPMGEFSERVLACAKDLGYTTVLWSFAYPDWDVNNQPDKDAAFKKITGKTHNGAVYLLHAVSETNSAILGDVLDFWKDSGYSVSPM